MSVINMFSLKDKIALVTGASYGIGFEIAKALHSAGATIVFNDLNESNLKKDWTLTKLPEFMLTDICLISLMKQVLLLI